MDSHADGVWMRRREFLRLALAAGAAGLVWENAAAADEPVSLGKLDGFYRGTQLQSHLLSGRLELQKRPSTLSFGPGGTPMRSASAPFLGLLLAAAAPVATADVPLPMAGGPNTPTIQVSGINSFETSDDLKMVQARNARFQVVNTGATDGSHALQIDFRPVPAPSVARVSLVPAAPWSFQGLDELAMDITNPTSAAQPVSLRLDDAPRAGGASFSSYGFGTINPGTTVTFSFPISQRATDPIMSLPGCKPLWRASLPGGSIPSGPRRISGSTAITVFPIRC